MNNRINIMLSASMLTLLFLNDAYSNPARMLITNICSTQVSGTNIRLHRLSGSVDGFKTCILIKTNSPVEVVTDSENYLLSVNKVNSKRKLASGISLFYMNKEFKIVPLQETFSSNASNKTIVKTTADEIPLVEFPPVSE